MGDGAVRQGALHETFNMAMMWKLPVVFIIENNNYAMGTSVERTTNVTDLSKIGLSYEMPSRAVNGMRPEDVHFAIEEAAQRGRRGDGPTLLDIRTYRYKGHSMSDPQKYRSKNVTKNFSAFDIIIFLSKGKIYEKLFKKINSKKPETILDPFYYYKKINNFS